jgi:tryptophan halogenase
MSTRGYSRKSSAGRRCYVAKIGTLSMNEAIQKIIVLGSGSAGLLVSLALKKKHPDLQVTIVRSKGIPIIGVGEGATTSVTYFLHDFLGINTAAFFKIARPTWKLGIRFDWGPRKTFFYPFFNSANLRVPGVARELGFYAGDQLNYIDPHSALMTHDKAFARGPNGAPDMTGRHFAYHFENESFVDFLEQTAAASGIVTVEDTVVDVRRDGEHISELMLESGRSESADLFVDCSGFVSMLLGKSLHEPFISFKSSLFCERAVVGGWARGDEPIKPYTTAQTMNAGWAWQIEHENRINRGYVYSPAFISDEDALREFREKNPKVTDTRIVKFVSGRYARTWVGNAVGIGNSAAFVEPLEATALGAICMQAQLLAETLFESNRRIVPLHADLYNQRVSRYTDSIRRFLAIHYKFNTLLDTLFWRECREKVDLAGAEAIVDYYQQSGPGGMWSHVILDVFDFATIAGFSQLLVGQSVPFAAKVMPTPQEQQILRDLFLRNRQLGMTGYSVKEMLQLSRNPASSWN